MKRLLLTFVLSFVAAMPGHADTPPVHPEELALHAARQRALVAVHFHSRHGVTLDDEAAWTKSYGGESPTEMLHQRALEASLRDRAIQILAVRHDVGRALPFPGFAEHVQQVNESRQQAYDAKRILHGPLRQTAWQIYRYEIDTMRIRLRPIIAPSPDLEEEQIATLLEAAIAAEIAILRQPAQ